MPRPDHARSCPKDAGSTTAVRSLPLVVHFRRDVIACEAGQCFPSVSLESLGAVLPETGCILLTSSEQLMLEHFEVLCVPDVRVLALTNSRFKDERLDCAVYAYLPVKTPSALLERMVDNALDHIYLLATRREANVRLAAATHEIHELNEIGVALSAEHDSNKLLEMILSKSRQLTSADAGSIYLVRQAERVTPTNGHPQTMLQFELAQNDSVQIPFRDVTLNIDKHSIAGYVALTGEIVNIEDADDLGEDAPYKINHSFDVEYGYRTKSVLTVPMQNPHGEIVGVLQLINAKRNANARLDSLPAVLAQVVPFTEHQQALMASLASQAAVALENSDLYQAIERLFEGFVRASVSAIEQRDPTTSGHSFRVANMTVALAETVDRCNHGPYADVHFSRDAMKEIRYASLLHDFGKLGVREKVLVKAKKLYPAQLDLIRERFHFVKQSLEAGMMRAQVEYLLERGREEYLKRLPRLNREFQRRIEELDDYFRIVLDSNEPTVVEEGQFEHLLKIAACQFSDFDGQNRNLLTQEEVKVLSIRKGSLDDVERRQIEAHVVHSFNFLKQIPWTKEIRNIPEIARGHHEKLNGSGYPSGLTAPEIPLQTRMMTIADIFDALAAADRPYKKCVSTERALEILSHSVQDGELDPSLFELFLETRVYEKWKVELA